MTREPYSVFLKPGAARALESLELRDKRRVDKAILSLAEDPRPPGSTKLQGGEPTYRVRVGNYRILYDIDDGAITVLVLRIGHRRDVYRRM